MLCQVKITNFIGLCFFICAKKHKDSKVQKKKRIITVNQIVNDVTILTHLFFLSMRIFKPSAKIKDTTHKKVIEIFLFSPINNESVTNSDCSIAAFDPE